MISRLPAYLKVQFVRFCYKEKENVNAKILKEVKFPMMLDLYSLCSPELQQKLQPRRKEFKVSILKTHMNAYFASSLLNIRAIILTICHSGTFQKIGSCSMIILVV